MKLEMLTTRSTSMIRKRIQAASAKCAGGGRSVSYSLPGLAVLAVVAACGGGDGGSVAPPPPTSNAVSTVAVTPPSASLFVGETLRLTATAKNASGTMLPGQVATWQSSASAIATVASDGSVTALATGAAQVTATIDGKSASMAIVVQSPAKVHRIQLDYPSASLALGQEFTLEAALYDSVGQRVTKNNLSWVAGDTNVVRVNATGGVTATGTGQSHVTVSVDGVSTTSTVTVIAFASITAGPNVTCALTAAGVAYCAGADIGSLAIPVAKDLRFATLESDGHPIGGAWQMCGIALDAITYCWGSNSLGQLGVGDFGHRYVPTPVGGNHAFVQVSVGRSHVCGLTATGDAYCWGGNAVDTYWGFNERGALGVGDTLSRTLPTAVAGGHKFSQIEAGWGTTCALTTTNDAYCWGRNDLGQVGNGTNFGGLDSYEDAPQQVAGGLSFKQIVTKGPRSCGLTSNGRAYCWGNNTVYEVGSSQVAHICYGGKRCAGIPTAVETSQTFQSLSTSQFATCGVATEGETLCWGLNYRNLFGRTDMPTCPTAAGCTPVLPVTGPPVDLVSVSGGVEHFCGVARDGIAYCWGGNTVGERGWPGTTSEATPRPFSIAPGSQP